MHALPRWIHRIAPVATTVLLASIALLTVGCGRSGDKTSGAGQAAGDKSAAATKAAAAPQPAVSGTGEFNHAAALLLDGLLPAEETAFDDAQCVHWVDPAVGFVIDLGEVRRVTGVTLQVDNNDDYVLESSRDGAAYAPYVTVPATAGEFEWGMETVSTLAGHPEAVPGLAAAPVEARYLRLRGSGGDGAYAVSEVQVASESLAAADAAPGTETAAAPAATASTPAPTSAPTPAAAPASATGGAGHPAAQPAAGPQEGSDMSMEEVFDRVDENHDGRLTKQEYAAVWKDKLDVDKNFAFFDKDGSGFIERQEFLGLRDRALGGGRP